MCDTPRPIFVNGTGNPQVCTLWAITIVSGGGSIGRCHATHGINEPDPVSIRKSLKQVVNLWTKLRVELEFTLYK
ncbi:hypothetical protein [Microcoleus sp. herbarium12]|uniref:hypothetical protein n=1 Tax=Microcoleus sp. herbarium12 TaxID=3055437 RepID=UPI002FD59B4B